MACSGSFFQTEGEVALMSTDTSVIGEARKSCPVTVKLFSKCKIIPLLTFEGEPSLLDICALIGHEVMMYARSEVHYIV